MSRVLFLVNSLEQAHPNQTTVGLISRASHVTPTWVASLDAISHTPGGLSVRCVPIVGADPADVPHLLAGPAVTRDARSFDAVWVRLNPGRLPPASIVGVLETLTALRDAGLVVRNAPEGLLRAASKTFLTSLPLDCVAPSWSSRDPEFLRACVVALGGPAVVKPAVGTQGGGVTKVDGDSPALLPLLEKLVQEGPVIVQGYLPDAPQGDVRIHVVNGRVLEVGGHAAAVRRVPQHGEWRSNVALGGMPVPAELTPAQRRLVARIGPVLTRLGLWHVGLDVVGDRAVEVNVFSPGGLPDAERFTGQPFQDAVVRAFLDARPSDLAVGRLPPHAVELGATVVPGPNRPHGAVTT